MWALTPLRVEDTQHPVAAIASIWRRRQLVFEDVLFHVVDHLIRTGSDQLVRGTAQCRN
jgi:hypothetical protein